MGKREMGPVTRRELLKFLRDHDACDEAMAWVRRTKGSPAQLWRKCPESIWMAWLCLDAGIHVPGALAAWSTALRTESEEMPDGVLVTGYRLKRAVDLFRKSVPWTTVAPRVRRSLKAVRS